MSTSFRKNKSNGNQRRKEREWASVGKETRDGSLYWTAPERFDETAAITDRCDVYSFAIVVWEFMSSIGSYPKPEDGAKDKIPRPFAKLVFREQVRCSHFPYWSVSHLGII